MKKILFFILISFIANNLNGEVENIILKWDAALCLDICIPNLTQNLQQIPSVTNLTINASAGTAQMAWAANAPFSFAPFNLATRAVGIRLTDIRVRVRGTITYDADNFYIVSIGDQSRFLLLGPLRYEPGHYVIRQNIANHPLSLELKATLIEARDEQKIVTVEGPLFEPFRYTLAVISEQVKIPKREAEFDKRQMQMQRRVIVVPPPSPSPLSPSY